MSRYILHKTEQDFINFLNMQPDNIWYLAATTPYNARTEFARFRRMFIRTMNNINRRSLKK